MSRYIIQALVGLLLAWIMFMLSRKVNKDYAIFLRIAGVVLLIPLITLIIVLLMGVTGMTLGE